MSLMNVCIGDHVKKVLSWNPIQMIPDKEFHYIDLSSIDKDSKEIDLKSVQKLLGKNAPSRARQIVTLNDILIATVRPNLNGVAIIKNEFENGTASTGYCVLRVKDSLDTNYLIHWLQTKYFIQEMVNKASGASYPAVSDKIIKESKIPLPPIEQQKKIAAILDAADDLRQKDKALLTKYDELAQSLFLDMFGDPVLNPKNWDKVKFGEVGKLDRGKSKHRPRNAPELLGGVYPLI